LQGLRRQVDPVLFRCSAGCGLFRLQHLEQAVLQGRARRDLANALHVRGQRADLLGRQRALVEAGVLMLRRSPLARVSGRGGHVVAGRADDDADAGEARGAAVEVAVVPVVEQRGFHVVRRQAAETLGIRDEVVERGQLDLMGDHAETLLAADPATVVDVEVDSRAETVVERLVYSAAFPPGDPGPVLPSVEDGSGLVAEVDTADRILSSRCWASCWLTSTDGLLVDAGLDWLGVCEGGRDELVGRGAKLICAP